MSGIEASLQAPVVLCLPAMGVPAAFYEPLARALQDAGCAHAEVLELRGQGGHAQRAEHGADFGYREIVEEDIPAALDRLQAAWPGRPLFLLGHSLGGQLAVQACATLAGRLAGLVLVAAGTAHWRAWPPGRRGRAWLVVHAIGAVARLFPWYPGRRLGFGGNQPRRLMRDWSFNARSGRYRLHGSMHSTEALEAALARLTLPVLALAVRDDPVAPPGAAAELLRLLPAAALQQVGIDGVLSDKPWRRHFSWARRPAQAVACIVPWLQARAA